jgi:hypothetical protein
MDGLKRDMTLRRQNKAAISVKERKQQNTELCYLADSD